MAQQFNTPESSRTTSRRTEVETFVPTAIGAPLDRIRWAAVLGGLFTVLATIIVLTVLGLAIGLSTFDANNTQNFGIGAGIYGVVGVIVAFGLGGFIAARTSAVVGSGNGILNGAMVWIVALPLIVNLLGTGVGSLLGVATSAVGTVADTASQVVGPIVQDAADSVSTDPSAQATVSAAATQAVEGAQAAIEDIQEQIEDITPAQVNEVARDVSGPAWVALLALGLSAAAAIVGGLAGTRTKPTDVAILNR